MGTSITSGDRIFLAAITGDEQSGGIGAQTRAALAALDARLDEAGVDRRSLLTVHIWLADMALFQEMTAVWNGWIGNDEPPSRSCVSAGALQPGALIQVVATAASPAANMANIPIDRYGLVRGTGRPTMCLALAHGNWFTVCTLASDCSQDITGQTRQILADFDRFLGEAGTERSKVLTVDLWLERMSDREAVEDVMAEWLDRDQLPAGSCVRADMARPEMLIEIRITAAR